MMHVYLSNSTHVESQYKLTSPVHSTPMLTLSPSAAFRLYRLSGAVSLVRSLLLESMPESLITPRDMSAIFGCRMTSDAFKQTAGFAAYIRNKTYLKIQKPVKITSLLTFTFRCKQIQVIQKTMWFSHNGWQQLQHRISNVHRVSRIEPLSLPGSVEALASVR